MNDEQLLRHSHHLRLPGIGLEGQSRLLSARALVVGAGGLGSPTALYLAAAGVGTIVICDHDVVDASNLQRQILHSTSSVGTPKVLSARETLAAIDASLNIVASSERIDGERLLQHVAEADVVLDCSDNFATRHALNRACLLYGKPLVSGTATRFEGFVCAFDARDLDSPCYACLFPEEVDTDGERCALMGVFAPLTGIIGATQAAEAVKRLAGCGNSLTGRLLMLDTLEMRWREMVIARNADCVACAGSRGSRRAGGGLVRG